MKCYRCGGTMVFEKFYGICEDFFGWRCIFCGEIVDDVILENRRLMRQMPYERQEMKGFNV
jgi:hypothetical protein